MNSTSSPSKRIVVCADDFGMNPQINGAVLRLAEAGRLSAASCLVQGACFERDAQALRASGLQTGLHLNFTEALAAPGFCLPLGGLIVRAYAHRLDAGLLRDQIARQLDRFEAVLGRAPDFVDGHQHVHQLPQIRQALLAELVGRYPGRPPWLRSTRMRAQAGVPARLRAKARLIEALGARTLAWRARRLGFAMNGGFLGVYDFQGGESDYADLLQAWLRVARDGDVLMCHPAAAIHASDPLGPQRAAEYRVWADEAAGRWLRENKLQVEARRE